MDNALMVGLARQLTLRRAMDVTANNIANMSTAGFRAERPLYAPQSERPATHEDGPRPIQFVQDWSVLRDFTPGAVERTGRPLDVAIETDGFFIVDANGEDRFTRDGRFALDADGRLVTAQGYGVLDDAGGEIFLDLEGPEPVITQNGAVLVEGDEIARIQVVDFEDLSSLEKTGEGLFRTDALPEPINEPSLRQGFVESSNVAPILEITRMIEVQRAYESVTRMIKTEEDLKSKAIERLGRTS